MITKKNRKHIYSFVALTAMILILSVPLNIYASTRTTEIIMSGNSSLDEIAPLSDKKPFGDDLE